MKADFRDWLTRQGYGVKTIADRMAELTRIETHYGAVDDHLRRGDYDTLVAALTYSTDDARHGRPNPSRFDIRGDLRTNLASYKAALRLYKRYIDSETGT